MTCNPPNFRKGEKHNETILLARRNFMNLHESWLDYLYWDSEIES